MYVELPPADRREENIHVYYCMKNTKFAIFFRFHEKRTFPLPATYFGCVICYSISTISFLNSVVKVSLFHLWTKERRKVSYRVYRNIDIFLLGYKETENTLRICCMLFHETFPPCEISFSNLVLLSWMWIVFLI